MIAYLLWLGVFTLLPTVTLDGRAWTLPPSHRLCLAVGQWAFFVFVRPPAAETGRTPSWSLRLLIAGLPLSFASVVVSGVAWRTAATVEMAVAVVAMTLAGVRSAVGARWGLPLLLVVFGAPPLWEFLSEELLSLGPSEAGRWSPLSVLAAALRPDAALRPLAMLAVGAAVLQAVLHGLAGLRAESRGSAASPPAAGGGEAPRA